MSNTIYIKNKYYNWYFSIISKAKSQNRSKGFDEYFEDHHIHPKSFGGTRKKSNMVLLTGREHFICHCFLIRMVNKNTSYYHKMVKAVIMLKSINDNQQERYINSRL